MSEGSPEIISSLAYDNNNNNNNDDDDNNSNNNNNEGLMKMEG